MGDMDETNVVFQRKSTKLKQITNQELEHETELI